MPARLLDGVAVANQIRADVQPIGAPFTGRARRSRCLGIALAGNNPGSQVYVGSKMNSAGTAGLRAALKRLPSDASLNDLRAVVRRLNESDSHDGILVQSPLPAAMG